MERQGDKEMGRQGDKGRGIGYGFLEKVYDNRRKKNLDNLRKSAS